MNINTELLKNKKYNRAILHRLVKVSQEYRVLATLRYLFPGEYEQMERIEKPDLQDNINHFGIEVTSAVQKDDMKANRAFAEIDKNSSDSQRNAVKKIAESGYDINNTNGIMSISRSGTEDSEKVCLRNAIVNKCPKYHIYKKDFKTIGLAVLLPEIPSTYAENNISNWIKELYSEIDIPFDFIYVISCRFCIVYDIKSNLADKKDLNNTDSQLLSTIGRMTAEGELTLNSIEWK